MSLRQSQSPELEGSKNESEFPARLARFAFDAITHTSLALPWDLWIIDTTLWWSMQMLHERDCS
jgi:hypothetical protein